MRYLPQPASSAYRRDSKDIARVVLGEFDRLNGEVRPAAAPSALAEPPPREALPGPAALQAPAALPPRAEGTAIAQPALAKRTRRSRSQLYAEALAEYLARHAPDEVTEDMNAVIDQLGTAAGDPFVAVSARRILQSTDW